MTTDHQMARPDVPPEDPDFKFYSTAEVAELFGVTPETVRDWVKAGKLKSHKIGQRVKIRRDDLIAFGNSKY